MKLKIKFFDELTTRELYEIVRARTEIFLLEQKIICQDFDGVDYDSLHCFLEEDGKVLAYLRAYRTGEGEVKLGRVLSVTHGIGLGKRLMRGAIPEIQRRFGCSKILLHAQKHAQGFYEKLDFAVTSPDFLEEGIPHVAMTYREPGRDGVLMRRRKPIAVNEKENDMSQLKCGAAERCVTPPLGLNIPQCMSFNPATGVKDDLFTHAIALECYGKAVILISVDTSGLGATFTRRVREALHREIGIDPAAVMVSAIHIHTGGPQLMEVFWGQKEDKLVTDFFLRETVAAAVEAYHSRVPVTARYAFGFEDGISFCRNYQLTDGTIKMNPGRKRAAEIVCPVSEVDCTLSTLRFDDEQGRAVCEIVNFACHPDTVGGHEYSADYPGEMRRKLKDVYGNSHTVLFLNGCSGNVNHIDAFRFLEPDFHYPKDHYKIMGGILADDVLALHENLEPVEDMQISFALRRFRAPRRQPTAEDLQWASEALAAEPGSKVDKRMAKELLRLHKHPKRYELVEMQVLRIGELYVVGFPGEPFSDIGLELRGRVLPRQILISELANNELGYFATEPAFSAEVYEARLPSDPFELDVIDRMVDTAAELIESLDKN